MISLPISQESANKTLLHIKLIAILQPTLRKNSSYLLFYPNWSAFKMRLYIKQKGSNYLIYENKDEPPVFYGHWSRKRKIGLHSSIYCPQNGERLLVSIGKSKSNWRWIGPPRLYILQIVDLDKEVAVELINGWRGHFRFKINGSQYDLYTHYGHKKSLFKDNEQVAKFDKAIFNWGERDSGFVIANKDENKMLLLGLFLMIDMGERNDAEVSFDLGNLIPGVRPWDNRWLPKK